MTVKRYEYDFGGRPLIIETGKLAKQANGSVLVYYGDTVLLVTVTMSTEPRQGIDFFPLLVDYEERMYAAGKIPGGWGRREGRPPESAILSARAIDRTLRPLFPDGLRNDVQIVASVLSVDKDNSPDIPALIGASAALTISDIPFDGPVGGVNLGLIDDQFIINPGIEQSHDSDLDLIVGGTRDAVLMVEAGAKEVSETTMLDAIMYAHDVIKEIVQLQNKIREEMGKEKVQLELESMSNSLEEEVREYSTVSLKSAISTDDKLEREEKIEMVKEQTRKHFMDKHDDHVMEEDPSMEDPRDDIAEYEKSVVGLLETIVKEEVRSMILEENIRPDGRKPDDIRDIWCEVGILPRAHGSGVFTRGQTQVLSVVTLGSTGDEQRLDDLGDIESKRYIHHYNFPAYSVGEVRPMRGPGRREIGHGALAEKALIPVLPSEEEFPYTTRVVSEVLESNGSTSQASICGSTLALMDAGVPIKKPVSGIAMGLVKEEDSFAILSDIQGMEDALGDMDFKVAGTEDGITAIQMDMKVAGISRSLLEQALEKARMGRMHILEKMSEVISEPNKELSQFAPRMLKMNIDPEKIGNVIGPGGKIIKNIIEKTGADITIEDDGEIYLMSVDEESAKNTMKMIEDLTKEVEVGAMYLGKVVRTTSFGAFVEILPGKEGLVHISKLGKGHVKKVEDVVNRGDEVLVKVTEIDKQGRINLAHEDALDENGEIKKNRGRR